MNKVNKYNYKRIIKCIVAMICCFYLLFKILEYAGNFPPQKQPKQVIKNKLNILDRDDPEHKVFHMAHHQTRQNHSTLVSNHNESETESIQSEYRVYNYADTAVSGFKIGTVKLKFLPQFKNPCWVEHYTGEDVYNKNAFVRKEDYQKYPRIGKQVLNFPPRGVEITLDSGECNMSPCRLRCLPYYMLIGVAKSGTSDFSYRVQMHNQIMGACNKEIYFWTQYRNIINATVGDYADLFDRNVNKILRDPSVLKGVKYYDNILGEFTSMTFFDFSHWRKDERNFNLSEPKYTLVDDLMAVLPNIKLVLLLRNPTDRFYSNYNMFHRKTGNPVDFHRWVLGSIWWWQTCVRVKGLPERNCAYGSPKEMPAVYDLIGNRTAWWPRPYNYSGEIRFSMYGLHIISWIPYLKNMLIMRTEDYGKDLQTTYNQIVFPFLGVPPVTGRILKKLKYKEHKVRYSPMLKKTKIILDEFYRPFNEKLSKVLNDTKWLWPEYT